MRFYVESILIFLLFQRNISLRLRNREHEIQPDAVIKANYSSLEPAYATLYFGDKSAPRGKRRLGTMPSDTLVGGTKKTVHHPVVCLHSECESRHVDRREQFHASVRRPVGQCGNFRRGATQRGCRNASRSSVYDNGRSTISQRRSVFHTHAQHH